MPTVTEKRTNLYIVEVYQYSFFLTVNSNSSIDLIMILRQKSFHWNRFFSPPPPPIQPLWVISVPPPGRSVHQPVHYSSFNRRQLLPELVKLRRQPLGSLEKLFPGCVCLFNTLALTAAIPDEEKSGSFRSACVGARVCSRRKRITSQLFF